MSKNHCSPDNLPEQVEHPKHHQFIDRRGQNYGRLAVLYYVGRLRSDVPATAAWLCRCECGQHLIVVGGGLQSGNTKSCGCLKRDHAIARTYKHGYSETPEHWAWRALVQRCVNPASPSYRNYGGRGINVCERWCKSFVAFLEDMGPRPSPEHSIDRSDNNGNYEPGNCRWATKYRQVRNTRRNRLVTFRGETLCVADLARRHGLSPSALYSRLKLGWSLERALSQPTRPCRVMLTHNGKTLCVADWAREAGIDEKLFRQRLYYGWSLDLALSEPIRSEKYSKPQG